jgi:hypothetical protein
MLSLWQRKENNIPLYFMIIKKLLNFFFDLTKIILLCVFSKDFIYSLKIKFNKKIGIKNQYYKITIFT